jgi:phage I-like protein
LRFEGTVVVGELSSRPVLTTVRGESRPAHPDTAACMMMLSTRNGHGGQNVRSLKRGAAPVPALCSGEARPDFGLALPVALAQAEGGQAKPPEWIQLLPAGPEITARDGRKWTLPDPNVVVAFFKRGGIDLPIDIQHASELKGAEGGDAPAQAWINDMRVAGDGAVEGKVDWLSHGAARVTSKEYRYISPAILHTDGAIYGLKSAGLVTSPALTMPALAGHGGAANPKESTLKTEVSLAAMAAAAGLAATAAEPDVIAAIAAGRQALADVKDPAKFVPATDLAHMTTRATKAEADLAALHTAGVKAKGEALVDGAIKEGKIPPASREHYLELASANFESAEKFLASMPKIAGGVSGATAKDPAAEQKTGAEGLSEQQLDLCRSMGIKPEDYAKNTKKETA